jgi:hypothetical protein
MLWAVAVIYKIRYLIRDFKLFFEPSQHFVFFVKVLWSLLVYLYVLVLAFMADMPVHKKHQTFIRKDFTNRAVGKLVPYSESLHSNPVVYTDVFLAICPNRDLPRNFLP